MRIRGVRNLMDLPVVTEQQVHMGDITDVFLDPTEQRVIKLGVTWVMDNRQVSGSDSDLPFSQIASFDPHQAIVSDEIGETAGLDLLNYGDETLVSATGTLLDHPIVTRGGQRLGTIVDFFVDEEDGAILGYEVSNDAIENEHRKTQILAPTTDMEFRGSDIVIPDRITTVTLASVQGLRRMEEEQQEDADYVFEREGSSARTQNPELTDPIPDPNEYPPGHPVGFLEEDEEGLLG